MSLRPTRKPKKFSRWRWLWLVVPVLLVYPIFLTGRALLGVRTVEVAAAPLPLDGPEPPRVALDELLGLVVRDGRVDYSVLLAHRDLLWRYAATLATYGPESTPERFGGEAERLAYYINAYNALTLVGVVANWPVRTVQDVHGLFEPRAGVGFFWGLRFALDGEHVSLFELENDLIRAFGDARIHAAINCASASCPPLAAQAYDPARLEAQLDAAARRFASQPPYVEVSDAARQIRLSSIYSWYAGDFAAHAVRLGVGSRMLDWVVHYAEPAVAASLERGMAAGYAVVYAEYDWSLNAVEALGDP